MGTKPTVVDSVDMAFNEGYIAGCQHTWDTFRAGMYDCRQTVATDVRRKRTGNQRLSRQTEAA